MTRLLSHALPLFALLAATLTAGCSQGRPADWRDNNRLVVERRPAVLTLKKVGADALSEDDASLLASFADTYFQRGEGTILLSVRAEEDDEAKNAAKQRLELVARELNRMGIPENTLSPKLEPAVEGIAADSVRLRYDVYAVRVPQCGEWSESSTFTPLNNEPLSNFGCATARNIGLMVANPRDLIRPQNSEGRDATRGTDVIAKYRAGKSTISEGQVSSSVSTVGKQ
jgi:pilus assembly protein CpaD